MPSKRAGPDLPRPLRVHDDTAHGPKRSQGAMNTRGSGADKLAGRVALVTGGSRGIGRAIALRLAAEGAHLVVTYRQNRALAEEVVVAAEALGRHAIATKADLMRKGDIGEMFGAVRANFGRLDIFVANAAATAFRPLLEQKDYNVERTFAITVTAFILAAQQAVPLMPPGSRIIAISSLGASRAIPSYGFVGASKAALESLVRTLAQELGPRGIRVNAVSAGVVDTDALRFFPNREELLSSYAQRAPAGPVLTPQDVAGAVYLLCLPEAGMVTGHTLVVDGGYSISG